MTHTSTQLQTVSGTDESSGYRPRRVRVTTQQSSAQSKTEAPAQSPPATIHSGECEQLLRSSATGDADAFKNLYQLTSGRMFAAVRRAIWTRGEAEEVLQEVYLKVWRCASVYDAGQAPAITWMLRIARNHSIDHLRRTASCKAHEVADQDGRSGDGDRHDQRGLTQLAVDASPRPDEWLQIQEEGQRFDRLMKGLGASQRQVMVMAFREGFTQSDIAERMNAPLGTVKSWIRRGLLQMKLAIDQADSDQHGRDS